MDSKTINVGVVGYGFSAKVFHIPLITSTAGMKLVAVLERSADTSKQQFPDISVCKTIQEILHDSASVDLLVITSVNSTHYEYAKLAILAKKHVVVEKPFTIKYEQAAELARLAAENNVVLSVYHNRRYDSDFLTVSKLIRSNLLGNIVEVSSRFDRFRATKKSPNAWRENANEEGSGILFDLGPHLIDQAICLFGMPSSLFATLSNQRLIQNGPDDYFQISLFYPNKNLTVNLAASMLAAIKPPRFHIFGSNGSFIKFNLDPQEDQLKAGINPLTDPSFGVESPDNYGSIVTSATPENIRIDGKVASERGNYLLYYANVRDAILGSAPLAVTAQQAAQTVLVIEKAFQSATSNSVVTL
ncbi:putative oxidoreductase YdgJ [Smittium culicis]|uniref:Putative oxidoreductase YdgJ n=1 Tax=Smittium culicis TaxID=133412 RepID=A0A1R1Y0L7_9FUNG|nr:putative oxidoreductase YdgJ [Smittium culicis]